MFFDLPPPLTPRAAQRPSRIFREATRDSGGHMFVAEFCNRWRALRATGHGPAIRRCTEPRNGPCIGPDQAITRLRACLTFSG